MPFVLPLLQTLGTFVAGAAGVAGPITAGTAGVVGAGTVAAAGVGLAQVKKAITPSEQKARTLTQQATKRAEEAEKKIGVAQETAAATAAKATQRRRGRVTRTILTAGGQPDTFQRTLLGS